MTQDENTSRDRVQESIYSCADVHQRLLVLSLDPRKGKYARSDKLKKKNYDLIMHKIITDCNGDRYDASPG